MLSDHSEISRNRPTVVFMGTPEFATPALKAIHAVFPVSAVVTIPDKHKGRGLQVHSSPVKRAAEELGISRIFQPEKLRDPDFIHTLQELAPDIIVVIAFRILPRSVYSLASIGAFNIHASLLPKFRGAAPINWAIINGERKTGVTSFLLADKVDTGALVASKSISISESMTAGELHDALMPLAAQLALETCTALAQGTLQTTKQNDAEATKAPKIFRADCKIAWDRPAPQVRNFIHGMSPYPGAWTLLDGKSFKILRANVSDEQDLAPGEYRIKENAFIIGCASGALALEHVQTQGKRAMPIKEFLRGFRAQSQGALT